MKEGFYTALRTPVDNNGNLIVKSYKKHVEDQIEAGASGLLAMGSMGIEPYLKQSEYGKIALTVSETTRGRCPVLVGVMDNSITRVIERIESRVGIHILALRNTLVEVGAFKGFNCAMNILGYEGSFAPDYTGKAKEKDFDKVRRCMEKCGIV